MTATGYDDDRQIRRATRADADALTRVLADSFVDDPPLVWIIGDRADRDRLGPAFFRPFVDLVLDAGQAYTIDDARGESRSAGVAMWLDVDITAPEEDGGALRAALAEGIGPAYAERFFVLDDLFAACHPTHRSHVYMPFIGVRRDRQNRGLGTALLRHKLAELDAAGRPAYLEASSPRNAALYRRLGFAPIGAPVELPDGPSLVPMWRSPV